MKITTLTAEQRARFPEFVERCTAYGLSCEPADWARAERGINEMYAMANLPLVPIIRVSSPIVGALAAPITANILHAHRDSAVCSAVGSAVGSAVYSAVGSAVRSAVDKIWWHYWYGGQFWVSYTAWAAYIRDVLEVSVPINAYEDLSLSAGYLWPNRSFALVCDRPAHIRMRDGRLHSESGMAIQWRDGWGLHMLHGVRVPAWLVETPAAQIKSDAFAREPNVEIRREIIRKVGIERLLAGLDNRSLDAAGDYELLAVNLGDSVGVWPYLKMRNPSIGIWHMEAVPQEIKTVEKALNWRNGGDFTHIHPMS